MLGFHSISEYPISTIAIVVAFPPPHTTKGGMGYGEPGRLEERGRQDKKLYDDGLDTERRLRLLKEDEEWLLIMRCYLMYRS